MTITLVALRPVQDARVRAQGYLILDGAWRINDVQVVATPDGRLRVQLPRRRATAHHPAYDLAHPVNQSTRNQLEAAVLAEFAALTGGGS